MQPDESKCGHSEQRFLEKANCYFTNILNMVIMALHPLLLDSYVYMSILWYSVGLKMISYFSTVLYLDIMVAIS